MLSIKKNYYRFIPPLPTYYKILATSLSVKELNDICVGSTRFVLRTAMTDGGDINIFLCFPIVVSHVFYDVDHSKPNGLQKPMGIYDDGITSDQNRVCDYSSYYSTVVTKY